jgi:hypothetical protein
MAQSGKPLEFCIAASWDAEAQVWVATSEDVLGLVTEAPTLDALMEKLRVMVPELLELNGQVSNVGGQPAEIAFKLVATAQGTARLLPAA